MFLYRKITKKLFKMIASFAPSNNIRILLYRAAGYNIGQNVYIGGQVMVIDRLTDRNNLVIGDGVAISPGVTFVTSSEPNFSNIKPYVKVEHGKIKIGNNAWIGTRAIILPNVVVGEGAVVGAGAVVTKNVEPFTIVAGVPAKKINEVKIT